MPDPLAGRQPKELPNQAAVDTHPKAWLCAQCRARGPKQALECVGARRQLAELDPGDSRLRDPGSPAEGHLGQAGTPAGISEESSGSHVGILAGQEQRCYQPQGKRSSSWIAPN
jgi:hypothetical protein